MTDAASLLDCLAASYRLDLDGNEYVGSSSRPPRRCSSAVYAITPSPTTRAIECALAEAE